MNEHPDLGVPFEDYLSDNQAENLDQIESLYSEWPQHREHYANAVAIEIVEHMQRLARLQDAEEAATIDDDNETLKLARNQELHEGSIEGATVNEEGEWIWHKSSKKRIEVELPPEKRYSIVDPDAEPPSLEEDGIEESN